MSERQRSRLLGGLAIAALVSLLLCTLQERDPFPRFRLVANDMVYYLGTEDAIRYQDAPARITIVAIDDASLERLGRWTGWDRGYYAQLIDRLIPAKPRAIAFDIGFFEPAPGDDELAAALRRAETAVQPLAGIRWAEDVTTGPRALAGVQRPTPRLADASAALGSANVWADDDGVVRRLPLVVGADDQRVPALALAALGEYLLQPPNLDQSAENFRFVGRHIALSSRYDLLVNFVGPPSLVSGRQSFRVVSFVDVLDGRFDPAQFDDKIVFVGLLGATGFADDYWTPVSGVRTGKMAGVEIHANAAATILKEAFLVPQGLAVANATVVLFALIAGLLTARFSPVPAGLAVAALALAYLGFARMAFGLGHLVSVAYPLLALGLTYAGGAAYTVTVDQRQTRFLRGAMGRYLSPAVLDELVRHPEQLQLGGQKRVMTVLFSDIRGFTSLAEQLDPQAVVALLNEYLSAMTDVIYRHDGVLDKYMGDAIMAFWNGPLDQPDHARRACLAALDMVAELQVLQRRWQARGVPLLRMGVGLNTGEMYVGNMGSDRRFDYTVIGDSVNLGSRLEALNKEYGTSVILSQATLDALPDAEYTERFLDRVAVKGKAQATPIYELLGKASEYGSLTAELLAQYRRAASLYQQRAFMEAAAAFQAVLIARPDDRPSALFLERCEELLAAPPPGDWDGVFVMSHK